VPSINNLEESFQSLSEWIERLSVFWERELLRPEENVHTTEVEGEEKDLVELRRLKQTIRFWEGVGKEAGRGRGKMEGCLKGLGGEREYTYRSVENKIKEGKKTVI